MDFRTLHIMMTFVLLFANLMISITYPDMVFLSDDVNPAIYDSNTDNYVFNDDYLDAASGGFAEDPGSIVNEFGLFDALGAVWDYIKLVVGGLFALPSLIINLAIDSLMVAFLLVPTSLLYIIAFVGWVRW